MIEHEPKIPPIIELLNEIQNTKDEDFIKMAEFIKLFIEQEKLKRFGKEISTSNGKWTRERER